MSIPAGPRDSWQLDRGQLFQATSLVMLGYLASRVLGLVREMAIAHRFGTSAELGAYLAAFRVPDLLFQLVAGGALASAVIPTLSQVLARERPEEASRLASTLWNGVGLFLTLLAAASFLLAPLLARLLVPGYSPELQALTARLMRLLLLAPILFGLSGISGAVLNTHQRFLLPALAPSLYNLAIIAGALFLAPRHGVWALAGGAVVGAALHLLANLPGLARLGLRYRPLLDLRHPGLAEVIRLMLPRVLGLAAVQLNFLVNTVLASGLGREALAAVNFAWLLLMLPHGIVAQSVATAHFPTLSHQWAEGNRAGMRQTFSAALRLILFLTVPASLGLLLLRVPLIELLFQRGAFDRHSTQATAWALQFYALGLAFHAGVEICARTFYALRDTRTPVLVGGGAMLLNVALSLLLIHPLSFGGLALANSLATALELAGLVWLLHHRLEGLPGRTLVGDTLRILLASGIMAVGIAPGRWSGPPGALAAMAVGGLLYLASSLLLHRRLLRRALQAVLQRRAPREW